MQMKFKNGKIRIMQVSDPQDLQFIRPTMVRMLNTAYDKYNPDLIVLTGDNILGNHLCDARIGTRLAIKDKAGEYEAMRVAIDKLVSHIECRKIPFAMIYGNHDDRNSFTKEEQADIYRKYSCNIGLDDNESPDVATYNIPIYSEDGEAVKFNIWMMDSAWHDKEQDKCFEVVKPEAIEWYKKKSAQLKEANKNERREFQYHKQILDGTLPLTIGGGIGQSRVCMLLLGKLHIGEVQASLWSDDMIKKCAEKNVNLL
jgi:hypothetical protein